MKGYPATTTSTGLTDGTKCSTCGEWLVKQQVIARKTKYSQPMEVYTSNVSVRYTKTRRKKQTISTSKVFAIYYAQGSVSFRKVSGSNKLSINSSGKITVKKKTKKGTYKIKVAVTAAGNSTYESGTKIVTVKEKVK